MDVLLGPFFARGSVGGLLTDEAWVRALVQVEAAHARARGEEALAEAILAAKVNLDQIEADTARTASPLVPIVRMLREQAGPGVHFGTTSQDIVDTAVALVLGEALRRVVVDARAGADAAARLAAEHRDSPAMGRTLLQPALPTSFGLRAARWMNGLDEASDWVDHVRSADLVVDMGGPIGHAPPEIGTAVAAELGVGDSELSWHAIRLRPARVASALGGLSGILGKVARDVTLMAQHEVAEVAEGDPARGGSSSIAGKNNPVAAITVLMCTRRVPALLSTIFAGMEQEFERGAGSWQVEWATMSEVVRLTASAAAWGRDMLEHLRVDTERLADLAGADPDLGASADLVDRALAGRRPSGPLGPG
jgi:3-carboxy-cis,cis-muconate cycloisomerase